MRGTDQQTSQMFSYLSPEQMVPPDHPLRVIRPLANVALDRLSPAFLIRMPKLLGAAA